MAANINREAFLALAVMLIVTCIVAIRSVNHITVKRMQFEGKTTKQLLEEHSAAGKAEWGIRVGFVMTIITGLVPSPAHNCGVQPADVTELVGDNCWAASLSLIHTIGIIAGLAIAIIATMVRIFLPRAGPGSDDACCFAVSVARKHRAFGLHLFITLACLLVTGLIWLVVYLAHDNGAAFAIDYCRDYSSKAACLGYEIPNSWLTWAAARKREDNPTILTVNGWQCEWLEEISFTSAPCVRKSCDVDGRLAGRKLAIIAEFLGLVFGAFGVLEGINIIGILDRKAMQPKDAVEAM